MKNPKILVVTPEITYLPQGMGNMAQRMKAKAGGLADVSASLVSALFNLGADVHVALPNYRRMFNMDVFNFVSKELRLYHSKLSKDRIHLAEDRIFYYRDEVYSAYDGKNTKIALTFQREVINNIIPRVQPDLIHCNDWMTGLIPAMARRLEIPCLFTVHNIHTEPVTMHTIEEAGIDAAEFWSSLYFRRPPVSYEESRETNEVDLLASGIFSAHHINTVSPTFLDEIAYHHHRFIPPDVQREIANKRVAGCASGILNAPDPSFDPSTDQALVRNYDAKTVREGKLANKREFQKRTGLCAEDKAPIFFWPSRLDPMQKGCELLTDLLYDVIHDYRNEKLQIAVVANGEHQIHLHHIIKRHDLAGRVVVHDFEENLSRLGYAAADYMLMPSRFEPCGLPQMISCIYGTLPLVHNTGGLHDTVSHLRVEEDFGNGFVFDYYSTPGLRWTIDEAMRFHALDENVKQVQLSRIMRQGKQRFNHSTTAKEYIEVYQTMLKRKLVPTPLPDR